jgi:hydrogenase maturation protease
MTATGPDRPGWLVFGLGHPDRGDDAVGLRVADMVAGTVAAAGGDGAVVRVGTGIEPLALLDLLLPGCDLVVVDAVRTGAPAGTLLLRDLTRDPLPAGGAPGSGHLLGLDQVLALAGSLDRLTGEVRLVGIEAAGFGPGTGLSAAVAAAVRPAAQAVLGLVRTAAGRIEPCRSTTRSSPAPSPPGA